MARVLISSIGTGNRNGGYSEAIYGIDNRVYEKEKFIAKALCEHLKVDKLFLVGTQKSIWGAVFEDFGGDYEMSLKILEAKENKDLAEFIPSIEEIIDKKLGTKGSKCFIIEYGVNEEELWGNFDKFMEISKHLKSNDEIHLDITHSFRSLSLMSFVMSEFTSNALGSELNIQGVYYGMLEYSGENNGITPIVNLVMFFKLLRWSRAIRELKTYGNTKEILRLLKEDKSKANKFENFTNALSMSDMISLKSAIADLRTEISFFKDNKNKIYSLIGDDLEEFIKMLDVESISLLQYRMAEWYYKHQNYTSGYIMLAESIVSAIAEKYNLDTGKQYSTEKDRKKEYGSDRAKNILKNQKDVIGNTYREVLRIRNRIAHADSKNSKWNVEAERKIKNLPLYIEKVKSLFKNKK